MDAPTAIFGAPVLLALERVGAEWVARFADEQIVAVAGSLSRGQARSHARWAVARVTSS